MDKLILRFISLFNPIFVRGGVDTVQLYEILRIKLLIDGRTPVAIFNARNRTKKPMTRNSFGSVITTLVMGALMAIFLFILKMPLVGQAAYFTMFMVLMGLTLISDFTTILIDTRDQFIIIPRPVNDRTLTLSRILHITIYVLKLALLQGIPGIICVIFVDGPLAAPVLLLQIIQATLLTILLVNIMYLIMMRSLSAQRIKDVISYFQIGFSVVIFAIYYLLPRMVNMAVLQGIQVTAHWWAYALPSVWIASLNEAFFHASRLTPAVFVMAIAGLLLPLAGIWFVVTVLAPGFNRKLTAIATAGDTGTSTVKKSKVKRFGLVSLIANWVAPDPVENAGFRITWRLAARTREFKMKVYPAFAYLPIYVFYFILNSKHGWHSALPVLKSGGYVFIIYFSALILTTILQHISNSEKYKASWVYYALPIDQPGKILSGMMKAAISLYFFPYCLVLGIVIVAFCGPQAILNIALAFTITIIYCLMLSLFITRGLPFSRPVLNKQRGGKVFMSLLIFALTGALGFGHYMLIKYHFDIVILVGLVVMAFVLWLMFYYYKRQDWNSLEMEEF